MGCDRRAFDRPLSATVQCQPAVDHGHVRPFDHGADDDIVHEVEAFLSIEFSLPAEGAHGSIRANSMLAPRALLQRRRLPEEYMDPKSVYLSRPWLKFYEPGVPANPEVPLKSVPQAFDEATAKFGAKAALVFYGREISFRELRQHTDRLAGALAGFGLKKGDRIGLYLLNSPQFVIAYFAALKLGCAVTPISPVYTSHEVRFQLQNSGARVVICQDILFDKVEKSGAALEHIVVTNVSEYLPALKKFLGKSFLGKIFGDITISAPAIPKRENVHRLQDLLAQGAASVPAAAID